MTGEPERLHVDGFITIREAQERISVPRTFLTRAMNAGALPRYRVGYGRGRVLLRIEDVDALIKVRPDTAPDGGFTTAGVLTATLAAAVLVPCLAVPVIGVARDQHVDAAVQADLQRTVQAAADLEGAGDPLPGAPSDWAALSGDDGQDEAFVAYRVDGGVHAGGFLVLASDERTHTTYAATTWDTPAVQVQDGAVWHDGAVTWPKPTSVQGAGLSLVGTTWLNADRGIQWGGAR